MFSTLFALAKGAFTVFSGVGAGALVKVIGSLGQTVLAPLVDYYSTKEGEETKRQGIWANAMNASLQAEVKHAEVKSNERIALWSDPWFKGLTVFIVGGPAFYINSVLFVSVFHQFGWVVERAPADFLDVSFKIVLSFIGALGATGATVGAVRALRNK